MPSPLNLVVAHRIAHGLEGLANGPSMLSGHALFTLCGRTGNVSPVDRILSFGGSLELSPRNPVLSDRRCNRADDSAERSPDCGNARDHEIERASCRERV